MIDHNHMCVCLAQLGYDLNWKKHVTKRNSNLSSNVMIHVFFHFSEQVYH